MKRIRISFILITFLLAIVGIISCKQAAVVPGSPIRISVYGNSTNPVDIDWTIHGYSGLVGSYVLNNDNANPLVIERSVSATDFSQVEVTITDSGPTGNVVVFTGNTIGSIGFAEKIITLDATIETSPGSGVFIVGEGDFLEDANGKLLYILENPTIDPQVRVSDANNVFQIGGCRLFSSNRSDIVVEFTRDGRSLATVSTATTNEPVNLAYGSNAW